jgi:hypothetical protein
MTARERLKVAVDSIPLPAETLAGVVVAMLAQRVRPLSLPAAAAPAGLVLACGGFAVVVAAWRERGQDLWRSPQR